MHTRKWWPFKEVWSIKPETNSSDRSHRKIKIKEKAMGGQTLNNNDRIPVTKKLYKIKMIAERRKLLPSKGRNWTNPRLTSGKSKLTCKRADGSLAKKGSLRRIVS